MVAFVSKVFVFVILFLLNLQADWLEDYQRGNFKKNTNKIYSLVQSDLNNSKYLENSFKEGIADISNQLFAQVKSEQFLNKEVINDEFSKSFQNKIYIVSDLPIHGAIKEKELIRNDKYYLLLTLNKLKIAKTYKNLANELIYELDDLYKDFLNTNNTMQKEDILNLLVKKLENYEKYSFVAKILNQKNISEPKLKPYMLDKELRKINNKTASSVLELASIISKKLLKKDIDNTIKIYPYSFKDKDIFSDFSYELKNYLENKLSTNINISKKDEDQYKLTGTYFINKDELYVKSSLYDTKGEIITSFISKIKTNYFNDEYFNPKINTYKTQEQASINSNLDIQARINGSSKNLLFKNGDSVMLDIKVSKESYIYIVGNVKTKENKQLQYLLELNDSEKKDKFLMHIPYQNSNLWINLGEFDISPPLGIEVLHIFATNLEVSDILPKTKQTLIDGSIYNIIVDNKNKALRAEESISKTRALKRKKVKNVLEQSETILTFTSVNN